MAQGFNYGQLLNKACLAMIADVLSQVARDGLPGKHHFYITFDTTHPGVDMAASLRDRYPETMMIVIQEWYADLVVLKDRFTITLNFGNVPEPIVIPFDAITIFADPSVSWGCASTPSRRARTTRPTTAGRRRPRTRSSRTARPRASRRARWSASTSSARAEAPSGMRALRLTPEMVARCFRSVPEPETPPEGFTALDEDAIVARAAELLASAGPNGAGTGPIWIFAYGSLIWKPVFAPVEARRARAWGWRRAFCIEMTSWRGRPRRRA